jgi:SAM-dependent methyltransferase
MKEKILIGIPAYSTVSAETLEDYMRFAYHLGRRYQDYDFFLGVKSKSEQFRARNIIVESALAIGCDWLLMIDDDHVINIDGSPGTPEDGAAPYDFLKKLLAHDVDIVGPLYYQRGGSAHPVVMDDDEMEEPHFISDLDIGYKLEERAVQGGGCMLIKMHIFDKIKPPWFEPEFNMGTDVQICRKARDAGFKVYNDSSIEIGHVMNERTVITSQNKDLYKNDPGGVVYTPREMNWQVDSILHKYKYDAGEYLGIRENDIVHEMKKLWDNYDMHSLDLEALYGMGTEAYYANMGPEQLARQVLHHFTDNAKATMGAILQQLKPGTLRGMDFGCGSAPVGFELAKRGGFMHFIDVDGSPAYEFLKWRCKKYDLENVSFDWPEPGTLSYCVCLDSIEHLHNWEQVLEKIIHHLKKYGNFITNFMRCTDFGNDEHVFMDKPAFASFMVKNGMNIQSDCVFVKDGKYPMSSNERIEELPPV